MLVDKNALIERFHPLMQSVVENAVTKMRMAGVNADYDDMESDAQLVLLTLADKYVEGSCEHARAFFEKSLWTWLNHRYQDQRKAKTRTVQFDDDFDCAAPEYISDSEYEEREREEHAYYDDVSGDDPDLKRALRLMQHRDGVTHAKKVLGEWTWYKVVLPKLKAVLEVE